MFPSAVSLFLVVGAELSQEQSAPRIASFNVHGTLLEDAGLLIESVQLKQGELWTDARRQHLLQRLDRLGYSVEIRQTAGQDGLALTLTLRPFPVVRRIYVEGTTPLLDVFDAIFETDVRRRIGFHSGERLPEGTAQKKRFTEERLRVTEYLRKMGFFDADVELQVEPTSRPGEVNLRYSISQGPRYWLGDIHTVGNAALTTSEIQDFVRDQYRFVFWRFPFTEERLKKALEALLGEYHRRDYPAARVHSEFDATRDVDRERSRAHVRLRLRERRHVELKFLIEGEPVSPDTQEALRDVITVFRGGSYDDVELQASTRELAQYYQRDGYFHAHATVTRERTSRDDESIVFHIERGPELRVHEINFVGNHSFSASQLADVIETRAFNFWRWVKLSSGGYATTIQLGQDEKRLLEFYRERGFAEVRVRVLESPRRSAGTDVAPHDATAHSNNTLVVTFMINEGPRTRVDAVDFSSDPSASPLLPDMISLLADRPGRPFDPALVAGDQARLLRALNEAGYLYAEVGEPQVDRPRPNGVRLTYPVRWNAPAYFGPVFVRGNFKTREHVVRSELTFEPGDPFDMAKLEATERNLRSLGIFSTVRWALLGAEDKARTVTVLIEVEERHDDAGAFELGGGASTDNLAFVLLTYRNQNLFGLAQALELQTEYGFQIRSGRGTFSDRRLFGTRFQFDVTAFLRSEETQRLGPLFTVGTSATLSRKLGDHLRAYLRYEFQRVRLEKDLLRPAGSVDEPDTVELTPRTGALGPGVLWDWRDRPFAPTCGWSAGTFAQVASPYLGGQETFLRLHGDAQMYLPVSRDAAAFGSGCEGRRLRGALRAPITVAQAVRYDQGIPLDGDAFLPEIERFFAGGDTTVRGFEEDRLRATIVPYEVAPGVEAFRVVPEGGNIRLVHNLEFWFPLWEHSFLLGLPFVGALFLDNGLVTNSVEEITSREFRHGAGGALRLLAPFGFISFEYAWPLDPERGDDPTGRLHLNFGAAFQF